MKIWSQKFGVSSFHFCSVYFHYLGILKVKRDVRIFIISPNATERLIIKLIIAIADKSFVKKEDKYSKINIPSYFLNSLPNDKILDVSKFKAFADKKPHDLDTKIEISVGSCRKHCGKRRKCWLYQHFLLFPQCFQKLSFPKVLKVGIVW